ncbi:MAG: hypothetical protein MUC37_12815, partial [Hyphomicrobium sp.]|nr:hypothetical protein [Hyphomicrobium sp.]
VPLPFRKQVPSSSLFPAECGGMAAKIEAAPAGGISNESDDVGGLKVARAKSTSNLFTDESGLNVGPNTRCIRQDADYRGAGFLSFLIGLVRSAVAAVAIAKRLSRNVADPEERVIHRRL